MTSPLQFDPTSTAGPSKSFERFSRDEIEQSIASRFEKQAKRYRDLLAIKTADCILTYGELNRFANRIAHTLLNLTDASNTPVALIPQNNAAMIAGILSLLKAGKIYVPLDPSLPLARNEFILKNSQAEVIVTSHENLALAADFVSRRLFGPLHVRASPARASGRPRGPRRVGFTFSQA